MGLMVVVVGATLIEPAIAGAVVIGIGLYAGHHALSKGALFLGVGLRKSAPGPSQSWVLVGLLVLALSMAAVPLTGGAVAKYGIKPAFVALEWTWLSIAVALTTMATAAMMARFIWIMVFTKPASEQGAAGQPGSDPQRAQASSLSRPEVTKVKYRDLIPLLAWSPLIILVLLYPLVFGSAVAWTTDMGLIALTGMLLLPIILVALRRPAILAPLKDSIPPGDLLGLVRPLILSLRWSVRWTLRRAGKAMEAGVAVMVSAVRKTLESRRSATWVELEQRLTAWPLAGALWLIIMAGLILLALLWPTLAKPPEIANSAASSVPDSEVGQHTSESAVVTSAVGSAAVSESTSKPDISDPEPVVPPAAESALTQDQEACDPNEPDRFTDGVDTTLELVRCRILDGVAERIAAPPVSNALLRLVQARLNDLGFAAGPVDGLDGPMTREAIRRFQASIGMAPNGIIDFALLDRLQPQP